MQREKKNMIQEWCSLFWANGHFSWTELVFSVPKHSHRVMLKQEVMQHSGKHGCVSQISIQFYLYRSKS